MAMQTTVERVEARVSVTVLALSGELDASNYLRLVDDVRPLYDAGARALLLDMAELSFISSSGLVSLYSILKVMQGQEPPDPEYGWSALHSMEQETEDGDWRVVIQSDNALERLNQIIAAEAPTLDPVRKVPNSARTYRIHPDSFNVLRKHLVTVSCGHTDATAEQANDAFDHGARTVTHLFNAMRPFRHRDPGIAGAALARDDVVVQIILDGVHLAPDTAQLVWRAAAGRVALVTDAMAGAGVTEGAYSLAGLEVLAQHRGVTEVDVRAAPPLDQVLAPDALAEALPELALDGAEQHDLAVARLVEVVQRPRVAGPERLAPAHMGADRHALALDGAVPARGVDPDAFAGGADAAERATREPLQIVARALDAEAPYFVDYISEELQARYRSVASAVDVYTTLDLHLQRLAQDAVRAGLARVDEILARRRRQRAQAALMVSSARFILRCTGSSTTPETGPSTACTMSSSVISRGLRASEYPPPGPETPVISPASTSRRSTR